MILQHGWIGVSKMVETHDIRANDCMRALRGIIELIAGNAPVQ